MNTLTKMTTTNSQIPVNTTDTKYCKKCNQTKPISCYYSTSAIVNGKYPVKCAAYCIECWKENNKKYRKTHTDRCTFFNLDKQKQDAIMEDMKKYIKFKQQGFNPPLSIPKLAIKHDMNKNSLQSWYARGVFNEIDNDNN